MPRKTLEERFWEKVSKQPGDGCWEWTAYRDRKGYGRFYMWKGCEPPAHRASWWIHYGEWPRPFPEYTLDHLCRNKSCVRPDHLEDVTNNENVARSDKTRPGTALRTGKCFKGHDDWRLRREGNRQCRACDRDKKREHFQASPERRAERARQSREWRKANPSYERDRRANDPEYREKKNAAARARYARKKAEKESAA